MLWLCLVAPARAQLLSPGDLSRAHQSLEGDSHCLDCHSSGRGVVDALCQKCHGEIAVQLRTGSGLHGRKFKGKPCAECHVEHRGRDYALVRWPGGARERFDHELTGYGLHGEHAGVRCAECHTRRNARGAPTFTGLSQACGSCHEDPHEKRFGSDCARCHNEHSFRAVLLSRFDHGLARFPLRGKHAAVACKQCHGEPPKYRGLEFQRCSDCHQDPHEGRMGTGCESCHSERGWSELTMRRSEHPGLSILGGHARVRCASCHDRGADRAPSRGSRCVACHKPVHEARFGTDCADCHKRIQWLGLPDDLGRGVHARTPFPLRGAHDEVPCAECHDPKLPPARRFRQLGFERCADCHRDPHAGEFAARDGGECRPCHAEHGFAPALFGVEAHAGTAFPLVGRHVAVPCGQCHADAAGGAAGTPASATRSQQRLDFRLAARVCADCHKNPHGNQFERELRAGGCAHCHNPNAWDAPSIDHGTWPLTGAHSEAPCAACHDPTEQDRKSGRGASYRGVPRSCEGCHEDAHKGQFRLAEPVRRCDECHDTSTFAIARFDHARLTGFALEGLHQRVACSGCHPYEQLRNGESCTRFRLGYAKCADCHKNPHAEQKR